MPLPAVPSYLGLVDYIEGEPMVPLDEAGRAALDELVLDVVEASTDTRRFTPGALLEDVCCSLEPYPRAWCTIGGRPAHAAPTAIPERIFPARARKSAYACRTAPWWPPMAPSAGFSKNIGFLASCAIGIKDL
jgi:hypothetical protein